jgi:hypothetical protein
MDRSWLTGRTSAEHMRRTRPDYYAEVVHKAGQRPDAGSPPSGGDGSRDRADLRSS